MFPCVWCMPDQERAKECLRPLPYLELMGGHASGGEACDPPRIVDAPDTDDIHLIGRVVEGPPQGAVVADGRDQKDATGGDLEDLRQALVHSMEIDAYALIA